MTKQINLHTLVLMIGPSGSGKSTLANKLFEKHEIVSSDDIRAEMLGDFRIQTNQTDVWNEVTRRVRNKLQFGQRVVVDATNLVFKNRKTFIDIAKEYDVEIVYIVVNRPLEEKLATAGWRNEVPWLIEKHDAVFKSNLNQILRGDAVATVFDAQAAGFDPHIVKLGDESKLHNTDVMVIGDVHGNLDELIPMLTIAEEKKLHVLFLGDVIDYGANNIACFNIVYDFVRKGKAHMIWGNHEKKLIKWLESNFGETFNGKVGDGLAMTVNEIQELDAADQHNFLAKYRMLYFASRQHFVFRDHLCTHGAATPKMWTLRGHTLSGEDSNMAFYGEVDNTLPAREDGMPNRVYHWVNNVENGKTVVVGHDPRDKTAPMIVQNNQGGCVIFLDTGSSKGGKLSSLIVKM